MENMYLHERLCLWLGRIKLSRVILSVTLILFIVPIVTHYYLSKVRHSLIVYNLNVIYV